MTERAAGGGARHAIRAGFIPLLDCAPLIIAKALGFAEAEGIELRLLRETSWATLRDRIAVRHLDVAHMLAPMPVAANLGLTPLPAPLVAPMALGTGGNTITVSQGLLDELVGHGASADLDAASAVRAFAAMVATRRRRGAPRAILAVVHPFSAHRYQLSYWLASAGIDPERDVELVVVPPPLMPAALAGAQIDGFCAGEPWGSVARASGGRILTTNAHIWRSSPEKVLGMRRDWSEADPDRTSRLIRAVYRAAVWCDAVENRAALAGLLSGPDALDQPIDVLMQGLARRPGADGHPSAAVAGFLSYAAQAATFPWVSHALWFFTQMVRWGEAALSDDNVRAARASFRPDLYRAALQPLGVLLPSANAKVEGALSGETPVASPSGRLTLGPDTFFDGLIFDPDRVADYIANFQIRAR